MNNSAPKPTNWWKVLVIAGTIFAMLFCCCGGLMTLIFGSPILLLLGAGGTPVYVEEVPAAEEESTVWQIDYAAFETLPEGYCTFAGGKANPWENGPANINFAGMLRQDALNDGFSWQAYAEKMTSIKSVEGYIIPPKTEIGNDGGFQVGVCRANNELIAFIPYRGSDMEKTPFHQISFTFQWDDETIVACSDDTGIPGDYNGDCDGNVVDISGVSLYDVTVPEDLEYHFDQMAIVLGDLPTNYRSANYVDIRSMWINIDQ